MVPLAVGEPLRAAGGGIALALGGDWHLRRGSQSAACRGRRLCRTAAGSCPGTRGRLHGNGTSRVGRKRARRLDGQCGRHTGGCHHRGTHDPGRQPSYPAPERTSPRGLRRARIVRLHGRIPFVEVSADCSATPSLSMRGLCRNCARPVRRLRTGEGKSGAAVYSLRSRIRLTAWSGPFVMTSVARPLVGRMFSTRLGSLMDDQIRFAVSTASASVRSAYRRK